MFLPGPDDTSSDLQHCAGVIALHYGHQLLEVVPHTMHYPACVIEVGVYKFTALFIQHPEPNFETCQLLHSMIL